MNGYVALIKIDDDKMNAVFKRLREAEETIRACYDELRDMGVVIIGKEEDADSCN